MNGMRSKKRKPEIELPPPFIIMNQNCHVWTGLRDGGRRAVFSNNIDDAKSLHYDIQFNKVQGMVYENLEKIYL
jgi:hypothetical protein